ncbi:MAG TPA: N-acetylglucosamine-6-phosphate deacetylase [Candidatus Binataceae bacterium]|nr:N-acetylglucosamine-6-phosphate deacetylase [Candidatus Binataceae bacterium]
MAMMKTLSGEIARTDGSLTRGQITFAEKIVEVHEGPAAGNDYILPGFIDLQVNGSHGIDVMSADSPALRALGQKLACEGTTSWLPTAVTAPLERIERAHAAIASAIAAAEADLAAGQDSAAILGMHLEGPFISARRLGAHPALNLEPHGDEFERAFAMRALRLVTLAPELPGALDAIRRLVARGVAVSIGHTDATLEEARAAIAAGARMFTHLYNAMRPLGHRDPGVIAAALAKSEARPAIIPDGVHVHAEMLRLAYVARGMKGLIITSDKVALAGTEQDAALEVGRARAKIDRGAARLADGTLAGSIISMLDGVRLMVRDLGVPVAEAAVMAATNPAAVGGFKDRGRLDPGTRADLIVLSRALELKAVFIAGRELR